MGPKCQSYPEYKNQDSTVYRNISLKSLKANKHFSDFSVVIKRKYKLNIFTHKN